MKQLEIDQILRDTLADFRVSRGEKKALKKHVELWQNQGQLPLVRSRAFQLAQEELLGPQAKEVVEWLEDLVKILLPLSSEKADKPTVLFSPQDDCSGRIQSQLRMARRSIDICVFTITDNQISNEIFAAHQRKIPIRIITDNDKAEDLGSDIHPFRSAGIPIRTDESSYHMHHKFALIDQKVLISGSYNWTVSAARNNQENIVIHEDPFLVQSFSREFERLWKALN